MKHWVSPKIYKTDIAMRKRLIIALDFSEFAQNLLTHARILVEGNDAHVVIVHQSTVFAPSLTDLETRKEIAKQTNAENLGKIKEMLRQVNFPSQRVRFELSDQHLILTLERLLDEPYDHLLLMGVKGTGTLKKIFLGSNVVSAIQQLDCKILALAKSSTPVNPKRLLVGVNPQYPLNADQLNSLMEFYPTKINELVFFSVLTESEQLEKVEAYLKQVSAPFGIKFQIQTKVVREGDVSEQTKIMVKDLPNSLLVLQRGSRYFSDLVFRKMLINDLIYEGKVPLAVLP